MQEVVHSEVQRLQGDMLYTQAEDADALLANIDIAAASSSPAISSMPLWLRQTVIQCDNLRGSS